MMSPNPSPVYRHDAAMFADAAECGEMPPSPIVMNRQDVANCDDATTHGVTVPVEMPYTLQPQCDRKVG